MSNQSQTSKSFGEHLLASPLFLLILGVFSLLFAVGALGTAVEAINHPEKSAESHRAAMEKKLDETYKLHIQAGHDVSFDEYRAGHTVVGGLDYSNSAAEDKRDGIIGFFVGSAIGAGALLRRRSIRRRTLPRAAAPAAKTITPPPISMAATNATPPPLPPVQKSRSWNPTIKAKHVVIGLAVLFVGLVFMSAIENAAKKKRAAESLSQSEITITADQPGREDAIQWAVMQAQSQYKSFVLLKTNVVKAPIVKTYRRVGARAEMDRRLLGEAWARELNNQVFTNSNYHCELLITNAVAKQQVGTLYRVEMAPHVDDAQGWNSLKNTYTLTDDKLIRKGSYATTQDLDDPVVKFQEVAPGRLGEVWNFDRQTTPSPVKVFWAEMKGPKW